MLDNGYILLHRKILDWEWYDEPNTLKLFIHLLLLANWRDGKWKGIEVKRGQLITSINHLAAGARLSKQVTRTSLERLKSTQEITISSTHHFTIITIIKYDTYQISSDCINTQNNTEINTRSTQQQHTDNTNIINIIKKEDNKEEYTRVFNFWNEQNIIQHKKMNGSESSLKNRLKEHTEDEIKQAILNYKKVLESDDYFFKYRWTLKDFLNRGLERFLQSARPLENFRVNKPINQKDKRANDGFDKEEFLKN